MNKYIHPAKAAKPVFGVSPAPTKRALLTILAILAIAMLRAQQIAVSGQVTDRETGELLIGVTVMEKGTDKGTVTDLSGKYAITVATDAILVFSYTGLKTQEQSVQGRAILDISMLPEVTYLDDIVVTGYTREFKSNVSSAIASVKSKDIDKLVVLGIDQALQGQAAGVQITQTT